jgi:hypothetical protein
MKTLLHQVEENGSVYQTFVEVKHSDYTINLLQFEFSSTWSNSKNPKEHQKRFEFFLTKEGAQKLSEFLIANSN